MKVLIACEESQEVCKAFRELGHEAYSCDTQNCIGGHPDDFILAHKKHFNKHYLEVALKNAGFKMPFRQNIFTLLTPSFFLHKIKIIARDVQ